jgi:hypothetical protein
MSQPARNGQRGAPAARHGRRAAPRLDAANLAGITTLMNPQHVRAGVNLEEVEKAVMGKNTARSKKNDIDPVRVYTDELNRLAEELGIDLLDGAAPAPPERGQLRLAGRAAPAPPERGQLRLADRAAPAPPERARPRLALGHGGARVADLIDDLDLDAGGGAAEAGSADEECDCDDDCPDDCECACHDDEGGSVEECDCDDDCPGDCECACHDEDSDGGDGSDGDGDESDGDGGTDDGGTDDGGTNDEKVDRIISRLEDNLGIKTDGKREKRRNRVRGEVAVPALAPRRSDRVTTEQERRRHINSVVSDIRGEMRTTFGVERERVQDIKVSKLEQIGQLRMTLEEEGIDCSSVSNPTPDSPMEEIDSVLNILRLKNDRNRYSSLAEEVILGFAEGIETVFDGSRAVPLVGWRPDYTGYHNTVNVKLHRMRFETSQVVGKIIEEYNVGPTARIFMELLPSFFLYPRQQKKQRGAPGLSSDPHVSDARGAMGSIRAADERQTLEAVRRI